jgi:5'(3')-deoxyribonucleotidase
MEKKLALVDVCDVVVDLRPATIKAAGINLDLESCNEWDIFNLISETDGLKVKELFNDPEFWRSLPPVKNAKEGIEGLRASGYDVHFLTSPWYTCKDWEGVRRAWLTEHFSWFHPLDMTATAYKYRFKGDILIDDRPKHVKTWQAAHPQGQAWTFDMDFNRFFQWSNRCVWGKEGIVKVR